MLKIEDFSFVCPCLEEAWKTYKQKNHCSCRLEQIRNRADKIPHFGTVSDEPTTACALKKVIMKMYKNQQCYIRDCDSLNISATLIEKQSTQQE